MKMNDTVARIIEIMFQDVEMNEEVSAIRDEVMNNCQERYNDLLASGMNEDDAIAAVIESLKGMDDVLAPYKRREEHTVGKWHYVYNDTQVQKIELNLVSESMIIEPAEDDMYHVIWDGDATPLVQCNVENGVMKIDRKEGKNTTVNRKERVHIHMDDEDASFDSLDDAIDGLGNAVDSALKSAGDILRSIFGGKGEGPRIKFNFSSDGQVTIQVPEGAIPEVKLLTTSGDLTIDGVALGEVAITTTSGDVHVDLNEDQRMSEASIRTTSGDIEANLCADEMNVSTISGDVEIEGRIGKLHTGSTSGDIDVRADVVSMSFKSISGDVDMEFDSDELREVSGSTVSGDVDIDLPVGLGSMAIQTQSRSGDVRTHYGVNGFGPTVSGRVGTISGDITIR